MGIARALRRVKRQAKRGGLGALRSGLGEELRSGAIPAPLRSAARRIAAIIDPRSKRSSYQPGSTATPVVERAPVETLRHAPPAQANKVGSDRGDAPVEPAELADTDPVDPITVGATPVYDATPIEVQPVDATPADVAPTDVAPIVIEADVTEAEVSEPVVAEPVVATQPQPQKDGGAKKKAAPSTPPAAKEKLAPASGQATPASRSTTKAKRPHGKSGKTSKKK